MAKTGSTIAEANVIVLVPVAVPPVKVMASPTEFGEVLTVPPTKELFGAQIVVVPLTTELPPTCPAYDTPTPPSVPAADPVVFPAVKVVQFVQIVTADAGAATTVRALMIAAALMMKSVRSVLICVFPLWRSFEPERVSFQEKSVPLRKNGADSMASG